MHVHDLLSFNTRIYTHLNINFYSKGYTKDLFCEMWTKSPCEFYSL